MVDRHGNWTRREFIVKSSAAGLGLAVSRTGARAGEVAEHMIGMAGMPLAVLGKTGEKVSILGFGCAGVSGRPRLLTLGIDQGINYIDTAEVYDGGKSEETVGAALTANAKRKEMFVVTKTQDRDLAKLEEHLDGSLEALQTDYVDLFYLHELDNPDALTEEVGAAAEALKKSGKIRFFGFSSHGGNQIPTLEKGAECGYIDVVMLKYNFRDYDDDALSAALDKCTEAKIGLVAMKTAAAAVPRYEEFEEEGLSKELVAIKATWADERIHVIISQMETVEEVEQNAGAAKDRRMTQREWDILERYARATDHLYCRGCGHLCEPGCVDKVAIADILRYRMYHEGYGQHERARELFAALPAEVKAIAGTDFTASEAACPHNLRIGEMLADAATRLA